MAIQKSLRALGTYPTPSLLSALVSELLYDFITSASAPALNDIIDLGPLPPDCSLVDCSIISDDLDTNVSPTITMSLGIQTADQSDLAQTFITSSNVAQNGGVARMTANATIAGGAIGSAGARLGLKITAAAATWVGAGKKIQAIVKLAP